MSKECVHFWCVGSFAYLLKYKLMLGSDIGTVTRQLGCKILVVFDGKELKVRNFSGHCISSPIVRKYDFLGSVLNILVQLKERI